MNVALLIMRLQICLSRLNRNWLLVVICLKADFSLVNRTVIKKIRSGFLLQ